MIEESSPARRTRPASSTPAITNANLSTAPDSRGAHAALAPAAPRAHTLIPAQPAGPLGEYVGRRSRSTGDALSVAALRERMALEALRRTDPEDAPIVAGALAAARAVAARPVAARPAVISPVVRESRPEPAIAPAVTTTTITTGPAESPAVSATRHSAPAGRRRASRASGPSVFRVPTATAPAPGSRVAVARRRATAASRRRPLLLSTPVIVAAIVVGGSIGGERLTSAGADAAGSTQSAAGTTGLGQSDVRVSRSKREAVAATDAASPTDTTTTANQPLTGSVEPAPADPAATTVAEGGAPAATPEASVTAAPPPPAATWVRPVEGGNVTSCFCTRWGTFHDGIDIDPPLGTPIVSVGDGTVVFAGPVSGYGIGIYIQHTDGSVSFYGHMAIYYVRTGDVVTTGEEIALVGNEGYSTGPHLHFSVFTSWNPNGLRQNAIDPIPWLADRGVTLGDYNPNG